MIFCMENKQSRLIEISDADNLAREAFDREGEALDLIVDSFEIETTGDVDHIATSGDGEIALLLGVLGQHDFPDLEDINHEPGDIMSLRVITKLAQAKHRGEASKITQVERHKILLGLYYNLLDLNKRLAKRTEILRAGALNGNYFLLDKQHLESERECQIKRQQKVEQLKRFVITHYFNREI